MPKGLTKLGHLTKKLPAALALEVLSNIATDLIENGLVKIEDGLNMMEIQRQFSYTFESMKANSGMLFGYAIFTGQDGERHSYGPIFFGTGARPAEPLVGIGFSNKSARSMGMYMANQLRPSAGLTPDQIKYYWAFETEDGTMNLSRVDAKSLHAEFVGTMFRLRVLSARGSQGPNIRRLADQSKLFDELEDRFRNELRVNRIEARLMSVRNRMQDAANLFQRANADRKAALRRAKEAESLSQTAKVLGLVANFGTLAEASMAQSEYNGTEMHNAASQYNINVESYILILKEGTGVSPGLLPESPKLVLP